MEGLTDEERSRLSYMLLKEWHGACYGMSSLAVLSCYGIFDPSTRDYNATTLYNVSIPPTYEILSAISYYYVIQCTDKIGELRAIGYDDYSEAQKTRFVINQVSAGLPTHISFEYYYPDENGNIKRGGHVIVGYDIEDGNYSFNGSEYNKKIITYDPNCIEYNDEACVYINTNDGSWIIPRYLYKNADSKLGAKLGNCSSDINYLNYHGLFETPAYTNPLSASVVNEIPEDYEFAPVLTAYSVQSDCTVQKIDLNNDGSYTICPDEEQDIKILPLFDDDDDSGLQHLNYYLNDKSKAYLLKPGDKKDIGLTLDTDNGLINIDFENADEVIIDPSGTIKVTGEKSGFNISTASNVKYSAADWHRVDVEGESAQVEFRLTDDGYILSGDELTDVKVSANGNTYEPACSFSTDYDKVLIHEVTENEIGISVDADDNGSFETQIETMEVTDILLGDLTGDKLIDANDATMILGLYAKLSTGSKDVTQESITLGDVNKDGLLDASDATLVLEYYSHASTGGTTKSEDFFKARQGNK